MKLLPLLLSLFLIACSTSSATPAASLSAEGAAAPLVDAGAQTAVVPPRTDVPEQPLAPSPKVDTRTAAQKAADAKREALAACRGSDGKWYCPKIAAPLMASTSPNAATCGPACAVGAWWFDPSNTSGCASDTNSGTSATCSSAGIGPLATFAQIITRLGSTIPQYPPGQSVAVTQMSAQAANTDVIFFEPRLSNGGQAILTVTPVAVGSPQTITVSTSKSRGAPGTLLTLTNPTGVTAKQLIINTTRSSQAIVDSVGATTVMQQPQTSASLNSTSVVPNPVEDDTWATGDTVQLYTLQNSNIKRWRPVGGDETSASKPTAGWVFTASIADPSGTGASVYFFGNNSACNVLVNCVVNGRTHCAAEGGRGQGYYLVGSSHAGQVYVITGDLELSGGGCASGFAAEGGQPFIQNDAILHGTNYVEGGLVSLSGVYSDGSIRIFGGQAIAYSYVWGSYAASCSFPGFSYINDTGSSFALKALLTSGTLQINGVSTGYSFTAATGLWGTGTALTPAAIDSAPGSSLYGQGGGYGFIAANGSN